MGETPLHWAAKNGHFEICRLIMSNINKKNPRNSYFHTQVYALSRNGMQAIEVHNNDEALNVSTLHIE